jgi:prevent-host-death family protein
MTNTITLSEAKILISEMIEKREITDTVVVEENGKPLAALIPAADYAFLVEAKQRITSPKPENLGWPPGFFERTFGCLKTEPLVREPQGEYETREELP